MSNYLRKTAAFDYEMRMFIHSTFLINFQHVLNFRDLPLKTRTKIPKFPKLMKYSNTFLKKKLLL